MHASNAATDNGAASRNAPSRLAVNGEEKANRSNRDGDKEREDGQPDVKGDWKTGIERKHRDEMRRPDTRSGGEARRQQPPETRPAAQRARPIKQAHRD